MQNGIDWVSRDFVKTYEDVRHELAQQVSQNFWGFGTKPFLVPHRCVAVKRELETLRARAKENGLKSLSFTPLSRRLQEQSGPALSNLLKGRRMGKR